MRNKIFLVSGVALFLWNWTYSAENNKKKADLQGVNSQNSIKVADVAEVIKSPNALRI